MNGSRYIKRRGERVSDAIRQNHSGFPGDECCGAIIGVALDTGYEVAAMFRKYPVEKWSEVATKSIVPDHQLNHLSPCADVLIIEN
jgi:hypothetical protein